MDISQNISTSRILQLQEPPMAREQCFGQPWSMLLDRVA